MLSVETIEAYNKIRTNTDKSVLCHAPFSSINFEQNGNMTACCYNRTHVLGTYPTNTIMEAWTGEKAEELRNYIRENNLDGGCIGCKEQLLSGNFHGSKALYYDNVSQQKPFFSDVFSFLRKQPKQRLPKIIELEISNTCNLECEMCNGYFSSSIRKNREKKPPLPNPYDDRFVEQLSELIPYLEEMKFLGGEPFLVDIYFKIWDKIIELNPRLKVHITTNGTVFNERIKALITKMNCSIAVSLDSLDPATYEGIRIGARFERVMENLNKMYEITKGRKDAFSIAICPMVTNWQGLPDLVNFANEKSIHTFYNTVWYPERLSLQSLYPFTMRRVIKYLNEKSTGFKTDTKIQRLNNLKYSELVKMMEYWLQLSVKKFTDVELTLVDEPTLLGLLPQSFLSKEIVLRILKNELDTIGYEKYPAVEKMIDTTLSDHDVAYTNTQFLKDAIARLASEYENQPLVFVAAYQEALMATQRICFPDFDAIAFEQKHKAFYEFITSNGNLSSTALKKAIEGTPLKQIIKISEFDMNKVNLTKVVVQPD
jgi:MoaA/NifB/PqqE/SkfB family radical SAM enzyme